jgi:hypothetical protein
VTLAGGRIGTRARLDGEQSLVLVIFGNHLNPLPKCGGSTKTSHFIVLNRGKYAP